MLVAVAHPENDMATVSPCRQEQCTREEPLTRIHIEAPVDPRPTCSIAREDWGMDPVATRCLLIFCVVSGLWWHRKADDFDVCTGGDPRQGHVDLFFMLPQPCTYFSESLTLFFGTAISHYFLM